MFVSLSHPPGHAQADFGEALVVIGGVQLKAHYLAVDLPHSDGRFVKSYPAETTEAFCDGHNAAFAFFGGVPQSIVYDCRNSALMGQNANGDSVLIVQSSALKSLSLNLLSLLQDLFPATV